MTFKDLLTRWNKNIYDGAQTYFSNKLGISRTTVLNWCKPYSKGPEEALRPKVAKELGITVEQLMRLFPSREQRNAEAHNLGAVSASLAAEAIPMPYGTPQTIPFFGSVCAGGTNFSFDAVPESYLPLYMPVPKGRRLGSWQVKGDCMDDGSVDAIHPDDIIICIEQDYAESGKIVVAMLDGEITLKKLLHSNDHIELQPSNPKHKPIIVTTENFKVLGVVIGTFRRL